MSDIYRINKLAYMQDINKFKIIIMFVLGGFLFFMLFYDSHLKNLKELNINIDNV